LETARVQVRGWTASVQVRGWTARVQVRGWTAQTDKKDGLVHLNQAETIVQCENSNLSILKIAQQKSIPCIMCMISYHTNFTVHTISELCEGYRTEIRTRFNE